MSDDGVFSLALRLHSNGRAKLIETTRERDDHTTIPEELLACGPQLIELDLHCSTDDSEYAETGAIVLGIDGYHWQDAGTGRRFCIHLQYQLSRLEASLLAQQLHAMLGITHE